MATTRLSLFSNGTFYQKQEGNAPLRNKVALLEVPGNVLNGTYWLSAGKGNKISQVTFEEDTIKKRKTAEQMPDLLAGNPGKKVTLKLQAGQGISSLSGTLVNYNRNTGLGRLDAESGSAAFFSGNNIVEVQFADRNLQGTFEADSVIKLAKLYTNASGSEAPVSVLSMQTGIKWYPSYYLKITDDKEAKLVMKATVENFALNADDAEADLVVGSPQMAYGTNLDPISQDYTQDPAPQPVYYRAMSKAARMPMAAPAPMAGTAYDGGMPEQTNYQTGGDRQADLYFYRTGKISLRKNTKTLLMISTSSVPCDEQYGVVIPTGIAYSSPSNTTDDWSDFGVAHSLKITNKTGAPLTDAPVFVLSATDDPIAQCAVTYTPNLKETYLSLGNAVNITSKAREEEVELQENAKRVGKSVYNLVTVTGTIKLSNTEEKTRKVLVTKQINGEVLQAEGGKTVKRGSYNNYNANSEIRWTAELPAGTDKTLTYRYRQYIQIQ